MDTASCKAGGSIIPNEVPVTAGLVERLSDTNPNPFTKFILILFLKDWSKDNIYHLVELLRPLDPSLLVIVTSK